MDVRPALACGDLVSAKTLLKVAVVLLGASVSMRAIIAAGPDLILGIAGVVVLAIAASHGLGRLTTWVAAPLGGVGCLRQLDLRATRRSPPWHR